MKKTKFIALAVAAAVMLMGAGYAYWSEQVVITNTVTTGNLDVDIVDPNAATFYYQGNATTGTLDNVYAQADITTDPDVDADDQDELTVNFTDLYPGSYGEVRVPIHNTGTMAVKLDSPIIVFEDDFDESSWLGHVDVRYTATGSANSDPITLTRSVVNGVVRYTFPEEVILEPEEFASFTLRATLPATVGADTPLFRNQDESRDDLSFTFQPHFSQFNAHNQ